MLGNKYIAGAVGILLALVIAYNVQFFLSRNSSTAPIEPARNPGLSKRASALLPTTTQAADINQPVNRGSDKTSWKRDPFTLRQAEKGDKKTEIDLDIKLMGIIKRDGNSHALINGKVYKVNDRIGTAVISEINKHNIVLLAEGKKKEISFDDYKDVKEKKK